MLRNYVDEEACARCRSKIATPVNLVGDFHTILCPRCTDNWSLYAKAEPLFEQLLENDDESAVRRMEIAFKGDYDQRRGLLTNLRKERQRIEKELYDKARLWVLKCDNSPTAEGEQPSPFK